MMLLSIILEIGTRGLLRPEIDFIKFQVESRFKDELSFGLAEAVPDLISLCFEKNPVPFNASSVCLSSKFISKIDLIKKILLHVG